ncbi:M24 family metallopeptidase [Halobaculum sp. WSA2]|uniref:M24 family metallopeptidase n=1 Tax=Halobaculum saliterrae TaxID=2073113 RepID=A0A6B0T0E4_9EURY|nr:M24 family metallopeptidase [Halobaculum saliterrae]MXR42092.1 M24 family metallopeptidase [Halobaculum saliterrae]
MSDAGEVEGVDAAVVAEKVAAAREAVAASDEADAWLSVGRETDVSPEPCFPYLLGFDVVWPTAVVVGPESSAVVLGRHDAPTARDLGVHEVRAYNESIAEPLREVLDGMGAERVALNFDRDDVVADGLSHGLFLQLREYLPDREFTSASDLIRRLRGVKSETEYERVRAAATETEELLQTATATWTPETTEREFADFLHERMTDRGLDSAWAWDYCPTVHMGDREVGHTLPADHTVDEGELLHVDFGVRRDGYASDIQRLWVRGEASEGLREAFRDVRAAIDAGHDVLGAGAVGHEVDTAAREELTSRGWPAFDHAFGHQVGRAAHDGGTLLGPEWERYGEAPRHEVRPGEVYTMELGVATEWGYVGQEEMVRVTDSGTEWVVPPQTELRTL